MITGRQSLHANDHPPGTVLQAGTWIALAIFAAIVSGIDLLALPTFHNETNEANLSPFSFYEWGGDLLSFGAAMLSRSEMSFRPDRPSCFCTPP
jgi:hypothetical protein